MASVQCATTTASTNMSIVLFLLSFKQMKASTDHPYQQHEQSTTTRPMFKQKDYTVALTVHGQGQTHCEINVDFN